MKEKPPCKQVLITGGAGFIGSHLVELLLAEGHCVTVIDNLCNGQMSNLKNCKGNSRFRFINADIRQPGNLQAICSQMDWVFHLAGLSSVRTSFEQARDYFETNVDGTYNILEASYNSGVQRFIYAASSSCYGLAEQYPTPETAPIRPASPYALTKYLGEMMVLQWAQVYNLPALSLRLFNVFGPRICTAGCEITVFGTFLRQKLRGEPFTIIGDGHQTRDFIYVTDVAEAFYEAAKSDVSNEILNVGSASSYSVNFLAEYFGGPVIYVPEKHGEARDSLADVDKIYRKLSWKAKVSLEEGIHRLFEHIEAQPEASRYAVIS